MVLDGFWVKRGRWVTHKARLVLFGIGGKCEFKTHFQCEDLLFGDHTMNPLVVQQYNTPEKSF